MDAEKSHVVAIVPPMRPRDDFQTLFCQKYEVSAEAYGSEVFKLTAYPHARWLKPIMGLFSRNYWLADYDFIHNVGRIRRFREYEQTVREYFDHPMNQNNLLRRWFLLRLSSVQLRRLVREVLRGTASENGKTAASGAPGIGAEARAPEGGRAPDQGALQSRSSLLAAL